MTSPPGGNAFEALQSAYRPLVRRYTPETSPFSVVFIDVTHRCNMECANCFIPNRALPDFPADELLALLHRFPRRIRVRLVGAEPTVREDLPELIRQVRELGHVPIVLTNGLKLGRRSYVTTLKRAGLRTLYLSMNGGLRDELYEAMDGMACAERKLLALSNVMDDRMRVTVGMILARGINEHHLAEFLQYLLARPRVTDIHLRSVGAIGRHLTGEPFALDELEIMLRDALKNESRSLEPLSAVGSSRDFRLGRVKVQLTEWPDLGSTSRGRLTPDGFVEPMFESMISNNGSY